MNINTTRFLLPLLLCAATSPVLAQNSGVIHFQGRIVASVCNDAISPDARAALSNGNTSAEMASTAEMGGCAGMSGSAISTTSVSSSGRRAVEQGAAASGAVSLKADGYTPDTVWTVTYQ